MIVQVIFVAVRAYCKFLVSHMYVAMCVLCVCTGVCNK